MQRLLTILILAAGFSKAYSQQFYESTAWRERIYNEIRDDNWIADYYMEEGMKADSLFTHISIADAIEYFKDPCYPIKYYSFMRILTLNDSIAFDYVKAHVNDSTVFYRVSTCMNDSHRFNEIIGDEYKRLIKAKYGDGYFRINTVIYTLGKTDRKKQKRKIKEVDQLYLANGHKAPRSYF